MARSAFAPGAETSLNSHGLRQDNCTRVQSQLSRLQIHTSRLQIQTSRLPSWARDLEAFMTSLSSLRPDGTQVTVPVPALLFAHSGIDSSMLCNRLRI